MCEPQSNLVVVSVEKDFLKINLNLPLGRHQTWHIKQADPDDCENVPAKK